MTALVIRGDARQLPLPDGSVDLIVTSPPYFALRSYQDGGVHYAGQIGSEATPAEFVAALLDCTREWMRVLKPAGSMWVNLGDKYATTCPPGSGGKGDASRIQQTHPGSFIEQRPSDYRRPDNGGIRPKSLLGIPWRYALGCIDGLGLILRAEVIWAKPNGLPESVTDRVRRSHEQWFHLVKQPRYYSAVVAAASKGISGHLAEPNRAWGNPLGKLPGSVWTIATEPLTVPEHLGVDHFAAFPTEWPRRLILGWSPPGICVGCGEGRRPRGSKSLIERNRNVAPLKYIGKDADAAATAMQGSVAFTITGYACACPTPDAPTRPGVVVDPFGGTGTTALVASALGRVGISVDLSHDYSRLSRWRTTNPAQRAKAMRVDKPPVEVDGQADLFGSIA